MPSLTSVLTDRFAAALIQAFGEDFARRDPVIRSSQFADFQANVALPLAKELKSKPRDIAAQIVQNLDLEGVCETPEISGPGFINLTFTPEFLASTLTAGGVAAAPENTDPQTIAIDYSAPNVAKEMHVGHLRTTVVGDALARTHEFLGNTVIRQNHIGDWGTPFGMLIEHLLDVGVDSAEASEVSENPNAFYQAARAKFDSDEAFATRSRARVVKLQGGDEETLGLWTTLVGYSREYFNRIYSLLDVTLTDDDLAGESTYNDVLAEVCDELEAKGLATISDGALCVFPEGFTGREGEPLPLIIRKSDGGYGYATTDLAAVRNRAINLGVNRALYVVGTPQAMHFDMVFTVARAAGWLPETFSPEHVKIGNVLGSDGKILRTRSGAPLRLAELLEEAVTRAKTTLAESSVDFEPAEADEVARIVGIGAVKYADLSVAHDTSYTFDLDRMLAPIGNTAPYLQYAGARIRSIGRKAEAEGVDASQVANAAISLGEAAERELALSILGFSDVVTEVAAGSTPHRLCTYLFDLAQAFTSFYEQCPVLIAETPELRDSRLRLSAIVLEVLQAGLGVLGIRVPERM
ncbi:arginyl-tRNA synthetase [Brevibacterium iodinum ATCC 49514]|uniref:Arginine--tRNA ligase n=1 Tax=Brevibacterium iodinum ATCC 49514 TaxID=1255616 RepID=A0A2H1IRW1_9MICO|nr:arginine--tRNA ligase [Brevibacterium iodinum]SMX77926.1 arginyl-tRNA synthetase [Brevibacterium iodinum ATCC 49514]SUW14121.1 Arginine--tRNA ligase [Brevibacterium iodinum]